VDGLLSLLYDKRASSAAIHPDSRDPEGLFTEFDFEMYGQKKSLLTQAHFF